MSVGTERRIERPTCVMRFGSERYTSESLAARLRGVHDLLDIASYQKVALKGDFYMTDPTSREVRRVKGGSVRAHVQFEVTHVRMYSPLTVVLTATIGAGVAAKAIQKLIQMSDEAVGLWEHWHEARTNVLKQKQERNHLSANKRGPDQLEFVAIVQKYLPAGQPGLRFEVDGQVESAASALRHMESVEQVDEGFVPPN